jgi:hypothetical protein
LYDSLTNDTRCEQYVYAPTNSPFAVACIFRKS